MQLQTIWIEKFGSPVVTTYGCWCRNSLADGEGIGRQIVLFAVPACFVILPERERIRLGSVRGEMYFLCMDIFLPECRLTHENERKDRERE